MNKVHQPVGVIRYSCGFLFIAFCFCYLYFVQGEVLAWTQHVLSGGLTSYSIVVGATIITFLLALLQHLLSRFVYFPNKHFALSFAPSFFALSMLTNINEDLDGKLIWGVWVWLLPLSLVVYILVVIIARKSERADEATMQSVSSLIWPNYLIMLLFIVGCGLVSTSNDVKKYEMKTERLLADKDYEAAARVGKNALVSSERLTQLRMYALSKQGLLADSMFSYPQYYGTKGLLDLRDTTTGNRFPMQNIEFHLGAFPGKTIHTSKRFLELLCSDSVLVNEHCQQYLLCYHLLDRDLHKFNSTLRTVYGDTIQAELPRAYQEAIVMQHPEFTPDSLPIYINKVYVERYVAYNALKDNITDKTERINRTRREYGNTYWWYFENK